MNEKDIELFSELFTHGLKEDTTVQISREPIELKTETLPPVTLFERLGLNQNTGLELIKSDLVKQLTVFVEQLKMREADKKYSKEVLKEEKRQKEVLKKLVPQINKQHG